MIRRPIGIRRIDRGFPLYGRDLSGYGSAMQRLPELVTASSAGNNQLLYFTSPSLTADESYLFFIGDRTGHPNLFARDLSTGRESMLSANEDGSLKSYVYFDGNPYRGFGKASVSLHPQSSTAYFIQGRSVCAVALGGKPRVLAELPEDQMTAFTHVSADGRRLCVPTVDARALDGSQRLAGKPSYNIDERVQKEKLVSYLHIYDTSAGHEIACEPVPCGWITHVQFSPADSACVLYNHEWPGDCGIRRIWLWDGKSHRALRDERDGRHRDDWVCHEMWERDGGAIIYHGAWKSGPSFVGRMQPDGSHIVELPLNAGKRYGHFTVGRPGELVSDGYYEQPDDTPPPFGGAWISALNVNWEKGSIDWTPLCRNGSSWDSQDSHPHPVFSHSCEFVYFTSDLSGKREIYRVPYAKP